MKFKITKNKIIASIVVIFVLIATFWYGGSAPDLQGFVEPSPLPKEHLEIDHQKEHQEEKEMLIVDKDTGEEQAEEATVAEPVVEPEVEPAIEATAEPKAKAPEVDGKDKYLTDPVPEGKPVAMDPQNTETSDVAYTASLSVRCDTILDNTEWLNPEKVELVPEDGVIFPTTQVTFYEGESVFNVLQREMKRAKIHMAFTNTPLYNSAYIDGIKNLYQFDCGELSGWVYKVNGWFPNYGSSRYLLEEGDKIEWHYTCDLGADVGGNNSVGQ